VDGAVRGIARLDLELPKQTAEADARALVADADADCSILVVDADGDHGTFESRVGHSGHCEKQLARQETRLFNHVRDNGPLARDGQYLRRPYGGRICRFNRPEGDKS
jgi:hypothetical protein